MFSTRRFDTCAVSLQTRVRSRGWIGLGVLALCVLAACASRARAQVSPGEHAKHHPGKTPASSPGAEARGGGMMRGDGGGMTSGGGMMGGDGGGMMGGGGMMDGMMERMGAPKPRDLYPRLMQLPDLPLEERQEISREARSRMSDGLRQLSLGLDELAGATPTEDLAAMQAGTSRMREGLATFESGLAAHRAIAEGRAPRRVALQWFKSEMNLVSAPDESGWRLWGMTPFHTALMAVLIAFSAAVSAMYFVKMRRASELLRRLAPTNTGGLGAPSPPESTPSPASVPTRSRDGETQPSDCCDETADACAAGELDAPFEAADGLLPVRRKRLCRLRVARIDDETPDVKTFRLVDCHGGRIPFSYLPGQFLTLTLPVDEKPIRRSYTMSSSPTQGYHCEITVKREPEGAGSRFLHDRVGVGDTLEVQAPSGKFVFTGEEAESIVLIGGGVGITPMMSVARALTDMAWPGEIHVVVVCHDPEHFIFESELRRLDDRYDNLHLHVTMTRIDEPTDRYARGRLTRDRLAEWIPDIAAHRIHVCGPSAMMDAAKETLLELGVPAENVHSESFGGERKPRARSELLRDRTAEDLAEHGGTVTFSKSNKSIEMQADETVLEAAERVGVDIDYSCRVGFCGVCTVKLLAGAVSMEVEDGLEPQERDAGMILACQAKSTSNVTVEA